MTDDTARNTKTTIVSTVGPKAGVPVRARASLHCHFRGLIVPRRCFLGNSYNRFFGPTKTLGQSGPAGARAGVFNLLGHAPPQVCLISLAVENPWARGWL